MTNEEILERWKWTMLNAYFQSMRDALRAAIERCQTTLEDVLASVTEIEEIMHVQTAEDVAEFAKKYHGTDVTKPVE